MRPHWTSNTHICSSRTIFSPGKLHLLGVFISTWKSNCTLLPPIFWLVGSWIEGEAQGRDQQKCSGLNVRVLCIWNLAHPSSLRMKLSAVSVFPKLNSPQWLHQRTIPLSSFVPDRGSWQSCNQKGVTDSGDLWASKREACALLPQIARATPLTAAKSTKALQLQHRN